MTEVLTKTLWDQRRFVLGWAVGLGAAALVYTASYAMFDVSTLDNLTEFMDEALIEAFGWEDFASPAGYLGSTVFGLVVPVLVMIFAIGAGARFIAGDEEDGILELTVTHPVSRTSLVLQKAGALALECLAMAAVVFVVVGVMLGPIGLDVSVGNVALACLQLFLLALALGTFTLAAGAVVGRRGLVIGIAAGLAAFAFFADNIVQQVEGLEWIKNLSFFHFYGGASVLSDGLLVGDTVILILSSVVFVAVAATMFDRRDVGI